MHFTDALVWLQTSAFARFVAKSNHLVGASLQIIHILGFVVMLASLLLVSLRVVGVLLQERPLEDVAHDGLRLLWIGFAAAFTSGVFMFSASPLLYFPNPAFKAKMLFLAAAVLLQLLWYRGIVRGRITSPLAVRTGVALSAASWVGIALSGRLIGFI
jgi:hypothetical protein